MKGIYSFLTTKARRHEG